MSPCVHNTYYCGPDSKTRGHVGVASRLWCGHPAAASSHVCHQLCSSGWPLAKPPSGAPSRNSVAHARHNAGVYLAAKLVFQTVILLPVTLSTMLTRPSRISCSCGREAPPRVGAFGGALAVSEAPPGVGAFGGALAVEVGVGASCYQQRFSLLSITA